jgi:threonyl-tRNA synthetase
MERFFAILIEHFGGAFPTWLAPTQVMFIPVNESCHEYVSGISTELSAKRIRCEIDQTDNSFNKKVRNAVTQKIPNIVIIGNNEVAEGTITLRRYCVKEQLSMTKDSFISRIERITKERVMDNNPEIQIL